MKKLAQFVGLLTFLGLLMSCAITTKIVEKQGVFDRLAPIIDYNHVIVKYPDAWTPDRIEDFLDGLPIKNDDQYIKKCKCGDPRLVQLTWDFNQIPLGDVQGAKNGLDGQLAGSQGDWPFTFSLPLIEDDNNFKLIDYKNLQSFDFRLTPTHKFKTKKGLSLSNKQDEIVGLKQSLIYAGANDNKVNIAVIDTGIDYYKNKDLDAFLYSTENLDFGCVNQKSGWNFVDNNHDVTDENGHGTYVTRLITSQLYGKVNYNILPIKAFNAKGEGNYWDIVCALSYVKMVQEQNSDIQIVNASFGYSFFETDFSPENLEEYKNLSILKEQIEELGEKGVLVVGSAGNIKHNIEEKKKENFPASFTSENILGVGGYVLTDLGLLDTDGNYGKISLDVAAPYGDYEYTFRDKRFLWTTTENVKLQGSSYSAAFTSAKIAEIIKSEDYRNIPPIELKGILLNQNPQNPWTKFDASLEQKISLGRYLEN